MTYVSAGQIFEADILFNGTNANKTGTYTLDISCDPASGESNDTPATASPTRRT